MNKKLAGIAFWVLVLSAGAATALSWLAEENAHVRVPQKNPRAEPDQTNARKDQAPAWLQGQPLCARAER
jgi:hypothetical protein